MPRYVSPEGDDRIDDDPPEMGYDMEKCRCCGEPTYWEHCDFCEYSCNHDCIEELPRTAYVLVDLDVVICHWCDGEGSFVTSYTDQEETCRQCHGRGHVWNKKILFWDQHRVEGICHLCPGKDEHYLYHGECEREQRHPIQRWGRECSGCWGDGGTQIGGHNGYYEPCPRCGDSGTEWVKWDPARDKEEIPF